MPCQHLTQIQALHLPVSDSEVLKVLCPICGQVEVCAYTKMSNELVEVSEAARSQGNSKALPTTPASEQSGAQPDHGSLPDAI